MRKNKTLALLEIIISLTKSKAMSWRRVADTMGVVHHHNVFTSGLGRGVMRLTFEDFCPYLFLKVEGLEYAVGTDLTVEEQNEYNVQLLRLYNIVSKPFSEMDNFIDDILAKYGNASE